MDYICYRRKLGEVEVRKFIRQTVSAVHYLHQGGILHRYDRKYSRKYYTALGQSNRAFYVCFFEKVVRVVMHGFHRPPIL